MTLIRGNKEANTSASRYLFANDGIKIDKYIIQVGGKSYSASHLTSFEGREIVPDRVNVLVFGLLLGILVGFLAGALLASLLKSAFFLVLLIILGGLAGLWLSRVRLNSKFAILLTFSSGESAVYFTETEGEIDKLLELPRKLMQYAQSSKPG